MNGSSRKVTTAAWRLPCLIATLFLLFALSLGSSPIFFRSTVDITYYGQMNAAAVDPDTGYFYVLTQSAVLVLNDTYTGAFVPIYFQGNDTNFLDVTAIGGSLEIHQASDKSWLFLCQGSLAAVADLSSLDLTSGTLDFNIIYSIPSSSPDVVLSCSAGSGALWVSDSTSLLVFQPASSNWNDPWLSAGSPYYMGIAGNVFIMANGVAFFATYTAQIYRFYANPIPASISTANPIQARAVQGMIPLPALNATMALNQIMAIQYMSSGYSPTVLDAIISDMSLTSFRFGSLAADSQSGVFWNSFCDSTTSSVVIERFYLKPQEVQLSPTHKGVSDQRTVNTYSSCVDVNAIVGSSANSPGVVDTARGVVLNMPNNGLVVFSDMVNCSASTSCDQCSLDSMYCSWCVSPEGASCATLGSCTGSENITLQACPVLTSSIPPSASSAGTTTLIITGSNFPILMNETTSLGGLYCLIDGSDSLSPVTAISPSIISCILPPINVVGPTHLTLALSNGIVLDDVAQLPFNIYNCSLSTTCASCASYSQPDCVWCASDGICASKLDRNHVCPTSESAVISFASTQLHCAVLSSMAPSSIPVQFSSISGIPHNVTITSAFYNLTGNWQCVFFFPSATVKTLGTLSYYSSPFSNLSCPIPNYSGTFNGVSSAIPVQVFLNGSPFAPNALDFTYYNCSAFSTCGDCLSVPYCGWTLSTTQCGPSSLASSPASCPRALVVPPSTLGLTPTPLTVSGGQFVTSSSYSCAFGSPINTTGPASFVNSTSLACTAPAVSSVGDPFDVSVVVLLNGLPYVGAGNLRYYTCTPTTSTCSNCADPLHILCSWCTEHSYCNLTTSITFCPSMLSGRCPVITSVTPSLGSVFGALDVSLAGSNLGFSGSYECLFEGKENNSQYLVPTTSEPTSTLAECVTPNVSFSGAGSYEVTLRYNDTQDNINDLGSVAVFNFVDCHNTSDCSSCSANSQCIWCIYDSTCRFSSTETCTMGGSFAVQYPSRLCPTITNVVPSAAPISIVTNVTVTGTNLNIPGTEGSLRCIFDNAHLSIATFISSVSGVDTYQCQVLPEVTIFTGTFPFHFELHISGLAPYAPWLNAASVPNNFTLYDCSTATTCDQCATSTSSYCGWCSSDHTCSSQSMCSVPNTWAQVGCPRITSMSLYEADSVSINKPFALSVTGLSQLDTDIMNLVCVFSTPLNWTSAPVQQVDVSQGLVICNVGISPNNNSFVANASVSLINVNNGLPFTTNVGDAFYDPSSTIEYVQCAGGVSQPSCSSCLSTAGLDARCGWCVYSGGCGVSSSCYAGSPISAWLNAVSQCPSVTSISPTEGPSSGNTLITISGTSFIQDGPDLVNGPNLYCGFGSEVVPAVFVNTSALTCITPPTTLATGAIQSLPFSLLLQQPSFSGGYSNSSLSKKDVAASLSSMNTTSPTVNATSGSFIPFAPTSSFAFTFSFEKPPQSANLGWIAAPFILILLLAVALVMVVVLLRIRYKARKLTPPDFNIYAFSANMRLIREVPVEQRPQLLEIVPLLQEERYKLALAMKKVSSGSEDDLLSRALIYSAEPSAFALDMLIRFIESEVEDSKEVGELFRASSIACKMYTIYSKIVGIQYLWRTLARSVHTLEDAGLAEDKSQTVGSSKDGVTTGQVSMMDLGSLEVDPERLAEKLEREVDESVMADVSIYRYELVVKTSRIFKKVVDSISSVPRELRVVSKRVKQLVAPKYPQDEMDYKGVCAFFFLRFICPAVMTPQIYGVLEKAPGETSQRYFVLISKALQNLANGTLPSAKEEYMAKLDEFVTDNKATLHSFIDRLCNVQEVPGNTNESINTESSRNSKDAQKRPVVSEELLFSSLSFLRSHYHAHRNEILQIFRSDHDDEFADRINEIMGSTEPTEATKPPKKKKKHTPQ